MLIVLTCAALALRAAPLRAPAPRMVVKQASEIAVGAEMPFAEIELVKGECAAFDECELISTKDDILGKGKSIIIGMPGAFTPTCTSEHLPGYIRNARKFKGMGVRSVNIVTTNDAFIMTAWKRAMRKCMEAEGLSSLDNEVNMLADKDSNLIKALGMGFNMAPEKTAAWSFQLNAGLRSKRFAMVLNDGVVEHLAVDAGETEMDATSAESLMAVLKPSAKPVLSPEEGGAPVEDSAPALAALLAAAAAAHVAYSGNDVLAYADDVMRAFK